MVDSYSSIVAENIGFIELLSYLSEEFVVEPEFSPSYLHIARNEQKPSIFITTIY